MEYDCEIKNSELGFADTRSTLTWGRLEGMIVQSLFPHLSHFGVKINYRRERPRAFYNSIRALNTNYFFSTNSGASYVPQSKWMIDKYITSSEIGVGHSNWNERKLKQRNPFTSFLSAAVFAIRNTNHI
jgi:hypothetical protein